MSEQNQKGSLKELRQERSQWVEAARSRIKQTNQDLKLIKEQLAAGPRTVPQIAQATGLETHQVLWYVTAMRKYGLAVEGQKEGDYFQYALAESAGDN